MKKGDGAGMKILVTGGAGFIGSHLCDSLLSSGFEVVCADRLVFRHTNNIDHLFSNNRFTFEEIDLAVMDETLSLFEKYDIEAVYHLAANSDIKKGGQEPSIDFHDTLMTTHCVLEGMRKTGVSRLFFASTSAVYGGRSGESLVETAGGLLPVSYYGGAKFASEALISSYASMLDMSVMVFRFPNVIGPRLTHGVIFDFVAKLRKDPRRLEILGDGTQCKPYIYVHDLIEAIILLTAEWRQGIEIVNVGVRGAGTTVAQIAEIVVNEIGLEGVELLYTGGDRGWKGDVPKFEYDISKALSMGWQPSHTSDESVIATVRSVVEAC